MPGFEPWDVVRVPIPCTNRPVLARATAGGEGAPPLLWVCMVTSAENRPWPEDVLVSDLAEAGLPAPSLVRPAKIATIEALSADRIGRLPHADRPAVAAAIHARLARVLEARHA
jgi:mRNA interferase MazF